MSANRFTSIDEVHMHSEKTIHDYSGKKITDFFACNVFNGNKVREYVSDEGYKSWQNSVKAGNKIDRKMADQIASTSSISIVQGFSREKYAWSRQMPDAG